MEEEGEWKGKKIVWKRYQEGGRGESGSDFCPGAAENLKLIEKSL